MHRELPKVQEPAPTEVWAARVAEAVRISGLSKSEIYRLLAQGTIRARKAGKSTLILMDSVRAYIDSLPMVQPK